MADYDYVSGKKRIEEILDSKIDVIEKYKIPSGDSFTFANAYYGWVTGVFVDIRDSTSLFSKEDKELVSKVIRSFTSEVIEILRDSDNLREIGIRGDCVYAIYASPNKDDIFEISNMTFYINTFMKMLNNLLVKRSLPNIDVGIGISSSEELVVKAGRKGVGINNNIWIGNAVTKAANLSSYGNKDAYRTILLSDLTYSNIIEKLVNKYGEKARTWFKEFNNEEHGIYYDADIIQVEFNDWIDKGMKG